MLIWIQVMQELVNFFKKKKNKRNYSFLLQKRSLKSYKLLYMEDFEANCRGITRENFVPAEMYKVGV
jgi:hypothetical protein